MPSPPVIASSSSAKASDARVAGSAQLHPPLAAVPTDPCFRREKGSSLDAHSVNRVMGDLSGAGHAWPARLKVGPWYGQAEAGGAAAILARRTCRERFLLEVSGISTTLQCNRLSKMEYGAMNYKNELARVSGPSCLVKR